MSKGKIIVAGIGPGSKEDITPAVLKAITESDVIVGYKYYFSFIEDILKPGTKCVDSGMKKERIRAEEAFNYAEAGNTVCVISSGDAGIYGMAPLIFEMKLERKSDIELSVLPGISAFQKASALLGAPTGHDVCIISLSDLMTSWDTIEKRIVAAASADFVTAIYNPKSKGRYWQLNRLIELFLKERNADTPVGIVHQAGREEESIEVSTLRKFNTDTIDMFTVIIIGNSQSYITSDQKIITPRGYYRETDVEGASVGQNIMINSFRTINKEMKNSNIPLDKKWAMIHTIHTTADFDMENILYTDEAAVERIYKKFIQKEVDTVITDVSMVAAGIRKGALERLGIEVKCYLNDPRVIEMAKTKGITRSQAGIRLAVEEHPNALFAIGNAPTALIELCDLVLKGKAKPVGIIAAPVGFIHVCESKHMVKTLKSIPKIIIEGRKGGSNLAATLVNATLTLDDAEQLRPGRDV